MSNKYLPSRWAVFLIASWIYLISPGAFMGAMFPVVTDVELTAHTSEEFPGWSDVSGSFVKKRAGCNPLRLEWYLGSRNDPRVGVEYIWGAPQVRGEGYSIFSDWRVHVEPADVIFSNTHADVIHQCGISFDLAGETFRLDFPWETRTAFWR